LCITELFKFGEKANGQKVKINIDAINKYSGFTALHWAAYNEDREVVSLLLNIHGAKQLISKSGLFPVDLAGDRGHKETLNVFLSWFLADL
jgi:ankyrin repeat protein